MRMIVADALFADAVPAGGPMSRGVNRSGNDAFSGMVSQSMREHSDTPPSSGQGDRITSMQSSPEIQRPSDSSRSKDNIIAQERDVAEPVPPLLPLPVVDVDEVAAFDAAVGLLPPPVPTAPQDIGNAEAETLAVTMTGNSPDDPAIPAPKIGGPAIVLHGGQGGLQADLPADLPDGDAPDDGAFPKQVPPGSAPVLNEARQAPPAVQRDAHQVQPRNRPAHLASPMQPVSVPASGGMNAGVAVQMMAGTQEVPVNNTAAAGVHMKGAGAVVRDVPQDAIAETNADAADAADAVSGDGGQHAADKHAHSKDAVARAALQADDTSSGDDVAQAQVPAQSGPVSETMFSERPPSDQILLTRTTANLTGATLQSSGTQQAVPVATLAAEIAARHKAGGSRFEIRLDPPELGRIDVRLDVDRSGRVRSTLIVEKPETLDLLRHDLRSLERALDQAGFKSDPGSISLGLKNEQGTFGQNGRNFHQAILAGGNGERAVHMAEPLLATMPPYHAGSAHSGALDIHV